MAEKHATKKAAPRSGGKASSRFTAEERAAMKEATRDAEGENEVLAKIAEMADADRVLAERLHGIIRETAAELTPRTWYGMPAYAKDGKVLCYFQSGQKFKTRYATLGFSDKANLDEGAMWPVVFAVADLTPEVEQRIRTLLTTAMS